MATAWSRARSASTIATPPKPCAARASLIGLAVVNRQGEALGTVVGLLESGLQGVLRVQPDAAPGSAGAAAEERLIPFVAACIDEVDLAARRIVADWGLDY